MSDNALDAAVEKARKVLTQSARRQAGFQPITESELDAFADAIAARACRPLVEALEEIDMLYPMLRAAKIARAALAVHKEAK